MKITDTHVYFYGGFLSNFWDCEIEYDGYHFHSSEQLYMYLKARFFGDDEIADKIIYEAKNPKEAKRLGRSVKNFDDNKWSQSKFLIMLKALSNKFNQNPQLLNKLMDFKGRILVEASPYDKIWGVGLIEHDPKILDESNWEGLNLLGKCLNRIIEDGPIF